MTSIHGTVRAAYDNIMYQPLFRDYYESSDFYNLGYWDKNTKGQGEACSNLMELLISLFPEKRGPILDVACGKGATTRHLLRYFQAPEIIAINISERQLQTAKCNAPHCRYYLMNAAHLAFEDEFFANVISVEAAFHFDTREQFLREAYRVLKPGGSLVLSDVIHARVPGRRYNLIPTANLVKDLNAYEASYRRAGFQDIRIIDATKECWVGHRRNVLRWMSTRKFSPIGEVGRALIGLLILSAITRWCVLVTARKG